MDLKSLPPDCAQCELYDEYADKDIQVCMQAGKTWWVTNIGKIIIILHLINLTFLQIVIAEKIENDWHR